MRNDTRILFNAYVTRLAQLSGVQSARELYTVDPTVQQTLESKIQESSEFLSRINVIGVDEMQGAKVGLGVSGTIAGRTNVAANDRAPRDVTALDTKGYECKFTEFDTALPYNTLDVWAKFPDFQTRLRDAIATQQALDRIMIGFNGTSAAAATDRVAHPLLQDVNIGWLQHYRADAPTRVMDEVVAASGEIRVGKSGDYENLDALVYDAVNELIDAWHRERTDLVAVVGRKLLSDKYFPLINKDQPPTERIATDLIISQKRLGGLQAVRVPFVPDGAILVTPLSNLSIYFQNGKRRRKIDDNAKRNRIENYESSNEAYVVEDYGAGCLLENITLGDFSAP